MERGFFEQVLDAFEGFVGDHGELHYRAHGRGLKIWFDDAIKEHYEAQLIRHPDIGDGVALEIGFHLEYPKAPQNDEVLERVVKVKGWRKALGPDAEAGVFIGQDRWRRISETWPAPDADDEEAPIEIAARLADYVAEVEPRRRLT